MTTGQLIKGARKNAGITQDALGKKLGVSTSFIAQYETGKRKPKYDTIRRIADALGVEWTELVPPEVGSRMIVERIRSGLNVLSTPIERVTHDMERMTDEGQNKVADYAADIFPRYRAKDTPEPPPTSPEGTDTAPPQNTPEKPPEGE